MVRRFIVLCVLQIRQDPIPAIRFIAILVLLHDLEPNLKYLLFSYPKRLVGSL